MLLLPTQEDAFCCPEGAKLVTNGMNAARQPGNSLRCYQCKAILADIASKTLLVSSRQVFDAEFLEVVAILLFIEATNALAATLIGI